MNEAEAAAQPQVQAAAEALEQVQAMLQGIAASLPASPGEGTELEEEVSLRTVIECVLVDSLQPAISDLRAAVSEEPEEENLPTRALPLHEAERDRG